jgi:hypothetical protein
MNVRNAPKQISITAALLANIVFASLVVGGLCAWLVTYLGAQEIQRHESMRLNDIARSLGANLAQSMAARHADVRAVRDLFENELATAPERQKRAVMERARASRQHFSWLGLVAADGKILLGTGGLLEGQSVAGRNWFEGALTSPVFFGNLHPAKLLEPHIRNPDGAPLYLLDIAFPLRDATGTAIGVVGSHMNWRMIEDEVHQALAALGETERLAATVVAADGMILFDTLGATGNVGQLVDALDFGQMAEGRWPAGAVESMFVVAEMPPIVGIANGLVWRIAVRESAPAVRSGIARMKWQVFGGSLLAGLLFALFGLLAVRSVTLPLRALVDDITRFGETETISGVVVSDRIAEVREIHGAFLLMAARVAAHKEQLQETQIEIVNALGRAGEFRDNETGNHVIRMSLCCARLAELAGKDGQEVELIRMASQMHDIGKIGIPDHVLLKPGRFDDAERAVMERHAEIGARILTGVDTPLTVLARTIALTHHEKWDGSGYPRRLAGDAIPLEGRISAICDVFDALLSSRPYKQGWPLAKVVDLMREQAGRHFDPVLVSLFLDHLEDFTAIRDDFRDEPEAGGALQPAAG